MLCAEASKQLSWMIKYKHSLGWLKVLFSFLFVAALHANGISLETLIAAANRFPMNLDFSLTPTEC